MPRQEAPAAAEIGDQSCEIIGEVCGEEGRSVIDVIPGEDAGLAQPGTVADRLQRGEFLPVLGRGSLALAKPENPAVELRKRVDAAEGLADMLLEARRAVVVGAGRRPAFLRGQGDPSRARCWRSSLPCAWSAGRGRENGRRFPAAARPASGEETPAGTTAPRRSPQKADPRRAGRTPALRRAFRCRRRGRGRVSPGSRNEDGPPHDEALAQFLQRGVGLVELARDDRHRRHLAGR